MTNKDAGESLYANSTEEQIRNLERIAEQLQGLLAPLYETRIRATRIVSDEHRQTMLDHLLMGIDPDRQDSYDRYAVTTYLCRGWYDFTDAEVLEAWFDYMGPLPLHIQESELWRDSLSNNLGAVAAFGAWLEKSGGQH